MSRKQNGEKRFRQIFAEREDDMDTGRKKQKKYDRARVKVGAGIAGIVAAVAVFVVLLQMEKNVMEQYEKAYVYVAAGEIPKGNLITADNYVQYLKLMEMETRNIPDTALQSVDELVGLSAVFDVEKGVILTSGMFESREDILGSMEEPVIAGFKADDMYQVAGGVLRAGDRIHIYTVAGDDAVLAWESIYVQQVFDAAGESISGDDDTSIAQRINVYLDKNQVEAFYSGLAAGALRVVKVCE